MKDIQVLFAVRRDDDTVTKIVPGFRNGQSPISVKNNLAQRVLKIILTELGSDQFNADFGTDLQEFRKLATASQDDTILRALASHIISQAEEQIKAEQRKYTNLSEDEVLDRIEIINILLDEDTGLWNIRLAIYNQKNNISVVEI